jgi:SAM-dependent methyltransferase
MPTAPFDSCAKSYEILHDQNLAPVGAESREFLHAKLRWCARFATKHFRPTNSTRTFLDYGCGTGRFGHEFYSYFDEYWRYIGVDSSAASIKEAQEQCASESCQISHGSKNPLFFRLDSWNQSAAQYDFILAACVFHHIQPDRRQLVLRRLWDGLRQRGVIVIWEHNPWNPVTRRIVKDCPFDRDARLLSISEMIRLWRETIDKGETRYQFITFFPGTLRRLQPLEHLLGWLPLGGQWVFWGKKGE